jgi:hypothetical protein
MYPMKNHLDDEHMRLYEWSGAGPGTVAGIPEKPKRPHPWHASYGVLALLTSLLVLNGCDRKGPAEQAGEQVDQAIQGMKGEAGAPKDDAQAQPGPAEQAGRSVDEAREKAGQKIQQLGEDLQKP